MTKSQTREYMRLWYAKNRAHVRAYRKRYYRLNKPRLRKMWREWSRTHSATKRDWRFRHKYGITLKQRNTKVRRQKHLCMICQKRRPLHVDHDHKTKQVRDMLCKPCNTILGFAQENPRVLKRAIAYLRKWKNK